MNDLAKINYDDQKTIETLKATVAQNATQEEFAMFCAMCKSSGLNPFKREIWFIKIDNRVQMMTGFNGFLAIANSHPQFDGLECDVEFQGQTPVKATAKCYRKDRSRPSVGIAFITESKKNSPIWNSQPSQMLMKVAKSRALREAFTQEMGGLYTNDEIPAEEIQPIIAQSVPVDSKPTLYYYQISLLPADKKPLALDLLKANQGDCVEEKREIWAVTKELKKLSRVEIAEEKLAEVA